MSVLQLHSAFQIQMIILQLPELHFTVISKSSLEISHPEITRQLRDCLGAGALEKSGLWPRGCDPVAQTSASQN
jgi:hypothetical protein